MSRSLIESTFQKSYPPLEDLVDKRKHLVDPGVPVFEGGTKVLIGTNFLVHAIFHINVAAYIQYVSAGTIGLSLVLDIGSYVKTKFTSVSLTPSRRYDRIVACGPIQWLFRGVVISSSSSGMPFNLLAGSVTR